MVSPAGHSQQTPNETFETVRDSQALLRQVVKGVPIILWAMDPQGIIILSEGRGLSEIGLAPGQVVGQSVLEINAGREDILSYMRRALDGEAVVSVLESDGEIFETHYTPQFGPDGKLTSVIAVSNIITGRMQAEQALRESEARTRAIIDNSLDGILLTAPDGRILSANAAACQIYGYSEAELCAVGRAGVVDFDDPRARVFLEERARNGRARGEFNLIRKGGERFPAEVTSVIFLDRNGEPRTSMIVRDVSQRFAAEAALRASQQEYASIFNAAQDGLFIFNLEGQLVDFNPAACRMLGYAPGEFRQLQPAHYIHPDSLGMFARYLETIRQGETFKERAVGVRKDGALLRVEVIGAPFSYHEQPHLLAVVRDITTEWNAYQLLEQRVAERTRELSALLEVSRNVASSQELQPLLTLILNLLKTVVDYSGAGIVLIKDNQYEMIEYVGPQPREKMLGMQYPPQSDDGYQKVIQTRQPYRIGDIWGDAPLMRNLQARVGDLMQTYAPDVHAWMGVPLIVKGNLLGILRLDHPQPEYFSEEHARLALGFAEQAAIAIEKNRLYEQAQTLAAIEERQRLARELHDSISQTLYAIALGARTARALLERDPLAAAEPLDYCLSLAEAGLAEMRALIFELRPESLEREGLTAALQKQADSLQARTDLQVHTELSDEPPVALEIKQSLYRIAQEALNNITRHAQARRVWLAMHVVGGVVHLAIRDDGRGFDAHAEYLGHLGLRSMSERAQQIGAQLDIHSRPGQGTAVEITYPLCGSQADAAAPSG